MENAKPVRMPLGNQFKLSNSDSPQTDSERAKMRVTPYASAIGSLMYAMICTRPDIVHAVGVVSRFMSNPGVMHWEAVKWILRYLRGTKDRALVFGKGKLTLFGFVDADFAGSDYDKGGALQECDPSSKESRVPFADKAHRDQVPFHPITSGEEGTAAGEDPRRKEPCGHANQGGCDGEVEAVYGFDWP
ncbi:UNVERIFIED_CONTAM: Retrovirus-related Pol polyprotein from transposon TNT 1-94 [Sesamum indicum]